MLRSFALSCPQILLFCYGACASSPSLLFFQHSCTLLTPRPADLYFQLRSHHYLFQAEADDEEEEAKMNMPTAVGALVVVTVITSFCADYRASSSLYLDERGASRGDSTSFRRSSSS